MSRRPAACLLALLLAAGCGSSHATDSPVKRDLLRGVARIRTTHDPKTLQAELRRTLASLRRERGSTAAERRARRLALEGFAAELKGVRSLLDFTENDSGNVAAATRDAIRADRFRARGASSLRAAGRVLGVRIGSL